MATITLSLTGTIDGVAQTVTSSGTLDDTVLPHFFDAMRSQFALSPTIPVSVAKLTDTATFDMFAKDIASKASDDVRRFLISQATNQAASTLPNVSVTPVP